LLGLPDADKRALTEHVQRACEEPLKVGGNDDSRSSPLGFFNVAESYWAAAVALEKAELPSTHPSSPISFLYYHAIELYLKAFLRMHGHSAKELRGKKFGHRTCCLSERAAVVGLHFDDEDLQVFSLMACTDAVIRSRYIQTGYFHWPTPAALDRTCKSLRQSVGQSLKKANIPARI
jgi:hypothetical protein